MSVLFRIFLVIFICAGIGLGIKSAFEIYKSWVSTHGREVRRFDGEITGYEVKTDVIDHGASPTEYLSWFPQPRFKYKMGNEWKEETDKNIQFFKAFKEGKKVKVAVSSHGVVLIDFHTRYAFWGLVFIISLFFIFLPAAVWPMSGGSHVEILDKPVFKELPFKPKHFLYMILGIFSFAAIMTAAPYLYQLLPAGNGGKLIDALKEGKREDSSALIKKGANINAKEKYTKLSVLMVALQEDQKWIIDDLLKKGAKVNDQDSVGRTPLFYAVKAKNSEAAEKLIKKGARFKTGYSEDLLIMAVAQKDAKTAKLLIENGYDVKNKHEQFNMTAGDFAIIAGLPEIVRLINQKEGLFTAPDIFIKLAGEDRSKIDSLIRSGGYGNINFGKVTLEEWAEVCKKR